MLIGSLRSPATTRVDWPRSLDAKASPRPTLSTSCRTHFRTLISRPDSQALRDKPDDAARVLSTIVRNAARNLRRRHHHAKPHVDLDDHALAAPLPAPDEAIAQAETQAQLVGCMAKLGDAHRHVITLRVLEELSGEEAAQALGVSPGHVAVLLHRARKQLEACMSAA